MQINITFVIQIINFFITYKVLNSFLFKPAIASLQKKQQKKETLQKQIKEQQEELVSIEKEKIDAIVSFQKHVKENYPFLPSSTLEKSLELNITPTSPTATQKTDDKNIEKQMTDWLVKKVPNVY